MKKSRLYRNDFFLNILIISLCIAFPLLISYNDEGSGSVEVLLGSDVVKVLPLGTDTEFSPDGGHTVVCIRNGSAYISDSDCPDRLCMEMSPVTKDGGNVICLPNKVAIRQKKAKAIVGGADYVAG